ncbi:MAG TPA: helix-turn-helix transcriptional regulator [Magnetospirillum sp.]|jgi:transcriptional regulator with XRE-family HTH domain|nr:helix-turn-helix transcriptional regulator [Magnetospirillum sp.]
MATRGSSKYRARTETGEPDPVDVHVGGRLRLRRTLMGLSQTDLAKAVGLTFQQVQKYESGANRVSASRLYYIAESLDVPVSFFFDDMPRDGDLVEAPRASIEPDRELLELTRNYRSITDFEVRRGIYELVKRLASKAEAGE